MEDFIFALVDICEEINGSVNFVGGGVSGVFLVEAPVAHDQKKIFPIDAVDYGENAYVGFRSTSFQGIYVRCQCPFPAF